MSEITLTAQEEEFIERAKDATVVSFGIGSILTDSTPRLEVPGVMVIDYKDRDRAAIVWKLAMVAKAWEGGDF